MKMMIHDFIDMRGFLINPVDRFVLCFWCSGPNQGKERPFFPFWFFYSFPWFSMFDDMCPNNPTSGSLFCYNIFFFCFLYFPFFPLWEGGNSFKPFHGVLLYHKFVPNDIRLSVSASRPHHGYSSAPSQLFFFQRHKKRYIDQEKCNEPAHEFMFAIFPIFCLRAKNVKRVADIDIFRVEKKKKFRVEVKIERKSED